MSLTGRYALSEIGSSGKSGSFFYFSQDYRFIIKTLKPSEHNFLRKILRFYYEVSLNTFRAHTNRPSLLAILAFEKESKYLADKNFWASSPANVSNEENLLCRDGKHLSTKQRASRDLRPKGINARPNSSTCGHQTGRSSNFKGSKLGAKR